MCGSAPSAQSPYTVALQSASRSAASRTDMSPSRPPRRTAIRIRAEMKATHDA